MPDFQRLAASFTTLAIPPLRVRRAGQQSAVLIVAPGRRTMIQRRRNRYVGIVVEAALASTIIAAAIYLFG